jgi:branched-chain amino acid transport system permease protein
LRGDYFAVGSLAAAVALQAWVTNWKWAGGSSGFSVPFNKPPFGLELYHVAVVVAGLTLLVALAIRNSSFGLRLTAVRDDEPAARGLGVGVYSHRLSVLVISGALTAVGGALVCFQFAVLDPDGMFSLSWSLNAILMTIVGGAGSYCGPAVGVLVVYYGITKQFEDQQILASVIQGALLIAVVRFAPRGIWPMVAFGARRLVGRFRGRDGRPAPPPSAPPVEPDAVPEDVALA